MKNQDIRDELRRSRLFAQDLADELKVSKATVFNWLATDLPDEKRKRIFQAIDSAAEKRFSARKF